MKNLLSVGNSVSLFFIMLLMFSIFMIFSFDDNSNLTYVTPNDVPRTELNNFVIYQISDDTLITRLSASHAKQFDKFEEFEDVTLERLNNNIIDKITTPSAIKKGDSIFFDSGVNDFRDGYNLYTTKAVYRIDKNILEGNGSFSINGNFQDIKGYDIYYDGGTGRISAKNITAKLRINSKKSNKG